MGLFREELSRASINKIFLTFLVWVFFLPIGRNSHIFFAIQTIKIYFTLFGNETIENKYSWKRRKRGRRKNEGKEVRSRITFLFVESACRNRCRPRDKRGSTKTLFSHAPFSSLPFVFAAAEKKRKKTKKKKKSRASPPFFI